MAMATTTRADEQIQEDVLDIHDLLTERGIDVWARTILRPVRPQIA